MIYRNSQIIDLQEVFSVGMILLVKDHEKKGHGFCSCVHSRNGVRLQHVSIEVGRTLAWVQHKECRI